MAEGKLASVRTLLQTDYDLLKAVFDEVGVDSNGRATRSIYEPWLEKAGRTGCRRFLELLIERKSLTRSQLATLGVVSERSSTFRAYMAWLKRNGLIVVEGDTVRLQTV